MKKEKSLQNEEQVGVNGVFNQIYFEEELRKVISADPDLVADFIDSSLKEEQAMLKNGVYDQLKHEKEMINAMTEAIKKNPTLFNDVKEAKHITNEELMNIEELKKGFEKVVLETPYYSEVFGENHEK